MPPQSRSCPRNRGIEESRNLGSPPAACGAPARAYDRFIEPIPITHPGLGRLFVAPVDQELTFALRQQVLRPHQRVEEMSLAGAEHEDAIVMAAVTEDAEVVGTAAVTPETPPGSLGDVLPPGRRWRLRAMATRADARGGGIGGCVLDAVLAHVAVRGGGAVWCSARIPARSFYERAGFRTFGEPWVEEKIGPHILMWRMVHDASIGDDGRCDRARA